MGGRSVEPFTPEQKESKSKGENDELEARHLRQVCNFRWPDLCSFRWPLTAPSSSPIPSQDDVVGMQSDGSPFSP